MRHGKIPRRFRLESSLTYMAVACGALGYFAFQFKRPVVDLWETVALGAYPIFAGALGALFASWYRPPQARWFEVFWVPTLVLLIGAILANSVALFARALLTWRLPSMNLYEWAGTAVIVPLVFLSFVLPLAVVAGLGASAFLRRRAIALCVWRPNNPLERTREG